MLDIPHTSVSIAPPTTPPPAAIAQGDPWMESFLRKSPTPPHGYFRSVTMDDMLLALGCRAERLEQAWYAANNIPVHRGPATICTC